MKFTTTAEAVASIQSGERIFVQGSAATPQALLRALAERASELTAVEVVCISLIGDVPIAAPGMERSFVFNTPFVSEPVRRTVNEGPSDYIPLFLSQIHLLFEQNFLPLDAALIQVSPPDKHGFCSLGVSVDVARSAVRCAKRIIAQVNPRMPRTHGDGLLHVSQIFAMAEAEEALPEVNYAAQVGENEKRIGALIAELIEDRSTVQTGIGTIPDAVLSALSGHKDLGIHTEMFSDGVIRLVKEGVITNKYKKKFKGRISTAFALGTRALYDFVDDNPQCAFLEASYVNDTQNIRANPKMVAINSAIEIDLTGQVCADSIGTLQYSGVGGQMDFIRGASLSEGGKPIIAMTSTTAKGRSKIVPHLADGAGVVTTRAHVHWVITEYGAVNLFGKNLRQRAEALCNIAHPEHREALESEIRARFGAKMFGWG